MPRESPPRPLLKTLLFRHGLLQKTPFSKVYNSLFRFSDLGRSKRPSLKQLRFFIILAPKSPVYPVSGRSVSPPPPFSVRYRSLSPPPFPPPPFSVRCRSLSPPPIFKPCAAHIYQFHIWVHQWVGTIVFFFLLPVSEKDTNFKQNCYK